MPNEADQYLWKLIGRVQKSRLLRNIVAGAVVLGLVGLAGKFVYDLLPRYYSLKISGGDLLENGHYLARILQQEAGAYGVDLTVVPVSGSKAALDAVDDGKIDLALVHGGLDSEFARVEHAATLPPEFVQFIVKPGIAQVGDIRGKIANLGTTQSGIPDLVHQILELSGLRRQVDYIETNFTNEHLVGMRPERLPDVVVVVSYAPNDVAEFLVKERGYRVLEMKFPPSLAIRLGWVADARLLAYMYSIAPPVPDRDIGVVGVNLHLVANRAVEPRAIERVLETLYNPKVASRFRQKISDADILVPSGFPVSAGTEMYMARNDPFLPTALFDKLKALFGLLMSVVSTVLVGWKWYRAEEEPPPAEKDDKVLAGCLADLGDIDRDLAEVIELGGRIGQAPAQALLARLALLKAQVLEIAERGKLDNPTLVQTVLLCIGDTRAALLAALEPRPGGATAALAAAED